MAQQETSFPSGLFMDMDRSGPIPLYFQVSSRIEKAIVDGDLPPGSRLENEVALGERLGLSRPTIRRAIQDLVDKGLLVRRRGIGTQVVHGQVTRNVELTSLFEDLTKSGQKPGSELLTLETIDPSKAVVDALGLAADAKVLHIRRLRTADSVPVSVLENYLPADLVDLGADELAEHGLYQLLRSRGITMRIARQKIGARKATTEESQLLEIENHGPVLTAERISYDNSGRAVEFGHHCYRPDLYSFEVTLVDK